MTRLPSPRLPRSRPTRPRAAPAIKPPPRRPGSIAALPATDPVIPDRRPEAGFSGLNLMGLEGVGRDPDSQASGEERVDPIVILAVLAGLGGLASLYRRGAPLARRAGVGPDMAARTLLALAMLLWAASLLPPASTLFARLFSAHEAGHLLLRLLAPLLAVLAWPFPVLLAGLGRGPRRRLLGLARRLPSGLPAALLWLIGWFYLWHVPALAEAARRLPALLLLAHLGMAATGVLFFARLLDRRGDPVAMEQAPRLVAILVVILSNILLGSLTTLKEARLYPGYAGGLADEAIGGYTIWVPSSILMIAAILLLFVRWNAAEQRRWQNRHLGGGSNSAALEFPETARELRLKTEAPNRSIARLLGALSAGIAVTVISAVSVIVALR